MRGFTYTVSDPQGLHARNAISLCRLSGGFSSRVLMHVREEGGEVKEADCKDMMALMGLRVRQHTVVEITAEGEDEAEACAGLSASMPTFL